MENAAGSGCTALRTAALLPLGCGSARCRDAAEPRLSPLWEGRSQERNKHP